MRRFCLYREKRFPLVSQAKPASLTPCAWRLVPPLCRRMIANLHVVLYQPEIPPNTGNIARLCACTGCKLHLVQPLGFGLGDRQLKRAGLDYWDHLEMQVHQDWHACRSYLGNDRCWYALTTKADQSIWQAAFRTGDALVFGPETRGLPERILAELTALKIPMRQDAAVRSLNLSSACAICVYEAARQINM